MLTGGALPSLLRLQVPGGLRLVDLVAAGSGGMRPSAGGVSYGQEILWADGVTRAGIGGPAGGTVAGGDVVLSQQQTLAMAEAVARMVPQAINNNVQGSPGAALAVLRPVQQLGRQISSFRGAPLPRVTGLEGLPTLSEMVADALEGTRVGTYTPPNPKLPGGQLSDWLIAGAIGTLLGRASVALLGQWGQFWGGKNSRPLLEQPGSWADVAGQVVTVPVFGAATLTVRRTIRELATGCQFGETLIDSEQVSTRTSQASGPSSFQLVGSFDFSWSNGCGESGSFVMPPARVVWGFGSGATQEQELFGGASGASGAQTGYLYEHMVEVISLVVNGVEQAPPPVLLPGGPVTNTVEVDRSSPPAPGPLAPLPLPSAPESPAVPDAPAVSPGPQPAPGQAPSQPTFPSIAPSRPATPLPAPGVPALPGDGSSPQPQPQPTPTTPPGVVIPWPGAPPIGGPGQAPAPTLTGIAQEVGRIERKLDSIMAPRPAGPGGAPGNWQDQLDDLWDWLERFEPGGSYELRGVCEVDANGEPVETVVEHPWPSGLGSNLGVTGRLDAIAAMLQTHKELRQPICRNPKPQGEPVTVQFEEL